MRSAPAVTIRSADVIYKDEALFKNFTLTFPAARCTAVLGASGVGKSTLLRLLAGLSTGATVTQWQCDASDKQPLGGRLAYLSQQDALFPWLTAWENVVASLRLRGKALNKAACQRAEQLLIQVGLGDALHKKPVQLSGGMRQRVALARLLFEDASIILLDEPFAMIDAITRARLQALTMELLLGKTLIWVTHDPIEAVRVSHHIHVLGGRPVKCIGTLDLTKATVPVRDWRQPDFVRWHDELMKLLQRAVEENKTGCNAA